MPVYHGNTSGSITQVVANIPAKIISYSLVNKTGGAVTVTLYIRDLSNVDTAITPLNYSLAANQAVSYSGAIKVPSNYSIHLVVSGAVDYYFSCE